MHFTTTIPVLESIRILRVYASHRWFKSNILRYVELWVIKILFYLFSIMYIFYSDGKKSKFKK